MVATVTGRGEERSVQVTMIGHASVLVEAGPFRIISDPWYRGRAFNDGWDVHPAPVWEPRSLAEATHLWISHEHPDHLSIPTLKAVPPDVRAGLTVLFQRSWSSEVVGFLEKLGFGRLVEIEHGEKLSLGHGVSIMSWQVGHQDSALAIHHDGQTLLNLNDCKPTSAGARRLLTEIGPVDLLLDQFSIAGWAGNPDDGAALAASKQHALDTLFSHQQDFAPAATIPFASFMRFCHRENSYLNTAAVGLDEVADGWSSKGRSDLIMLHHGDRWAIGERAPDLAGAVERDRQHQRDRDAAPLVEPEPRERGEVVAALEERMDEWRRVFSAPLLRAVTDPVLFQIEDLDLEVVFDPIRRTDAPATTVHLTSQPAWFAGTQRFGIETLLISGRFRLSGDQTGWKRLKRVGGAYAAGIHPRSVVRTAATPRGRSVVTRRSISTAKDLLHAASR
jgi:UDP-MurNAc hydroxylase